MGDIIRIIFKCDGEEEEVVKLSYQFNRIIDATGKPTSEVCGGIIKITLRMHESRRCHRWALSSNKKSGYLEHIDIHSMIQKRVYFEDAYCVKYQKTFDVTDIAEYYGRKFHRGVFELLTICAKKITIDGYSYKNTYLTNIQKKKFLETSGTTYSDDELSEEQKLIIDNIKNQKWRITNDKDNPYKVFFLSLSYREEIDDNWMKKIGKLTDLKYLHIDGTSISDKGIRYLEELKNIEKLNLRGTNITDSSLESIAKLPNLESIWLNDTKIKGMNLNLLSKSKNLTKLFLGRTKITDNTLVNISEIQKLEELFVNDTEITIKSLDLFRNLPNLKCLDVTNTGITDNQIQNLKREFPKMTIHYIDW